MMKSLPGQNITYSLFHQIIKQTEASYRILKGSRGTGDKQEKKCLFLWKTTSLLFPLSGCWCESLQLLLSLQAKKEKIIQSLRTRRRMLCTTDMKASLCFRRTECFYTARAVWDQRDSHKRQLWTVWRGLWDSLRWMNIWNSQLGFEIHLYKWCSTEKGCELPFGHVDGHHLCHHLDH